MQDSKRYIHRCFDSWIGGWLQRNSCDYITSRTRVNGYLFPLRSFCSNNVEKFGITILIVQPSLTLLTDYVKRKVAYGIVVQERKANWIGYIQKPVPVGQSIFAIGEACFCVWHRSVMSRIFHLENLITWSSRIAIHPNTWNISDNHFLYSRFVYIAKRIWLLHRYFLEMLLLCYTLAY